jgi:MoxR-like ATPase
VEDLTGIASQVQEQSTWLTRVRAEVAKVIVGQNYLVERLLIALLCDGHILIEGVPGLAKTLAASSLAQVIQASWTRIQFTPDLLPADIIGTTIYNAQEGRFQVSRGPIFHNIVLADEINRAPAKVQSALLEAMQERQVSIAGATFPLEQPFMVLATQNPIESEGTYTLPEAQLDRFLLKAVVGYPTRQEEKEIVLRYMDGQQPKVQELLTPDDILMARESVRQVRLDDRLLDYITHLVFASRTPETYRLNHLTPFIAYGASPRASIFLAQTARAHALLQGRSYVIPEDIKAVALDVLRHRVIVTYEAEAEDLTPEAIVAQLLDGVAVP